MTSLAILLGIGLALAGCALLERWEARRARSSAPPRARADSRWHLIALGFRHGPARWK